MIALKLPVPPVPASRPRVPRFGKPYYTGRYKAFRELCKDIVPSVILSQLGEDFEPLQDPLELNVTFNATRPKSTKFDFPPGDYDNYLKSLDVLNGELWEDDRQIVVAGCRKQWAPAGSEGWIDLVVEPLSAD